MDTGSGRVPSAPGSHPSGHAADGVDGAPRIDPSRNSLADRFIAWATKGVAIQPVVTFEDQPLFDRFEFLRKDEWPDSWWDPHRDQFPTRPNKLPWWLPFNAFLHRWGLGAETPESFHDHPRWSITVCLKGRIIERTPWGERILTPGSIVVRSRKAIHSFQVPPSAGEVWTLFIVGRRKHRQNTYAVVAR